MPVDPETKRRIIDLSLNEHKTIRDIAKISKKSSRDIIAVLRNSEHNGKAEEIRIFKGIIYQHQRKKKATRNMNMKTFL